MKPILFSTDMVRAILDGRKTQTRRVILFPAPYNVYRYDGVDEKGRHLFAWGLITENKCFYDGYFEIKPSYKPGDILWVRETFAVDACVPQCAGRDDENECPFNRVGNDCYKYKAQYIGKAPDIRWKPSIHMPKEAARIFLRVTDVRPEQIQEISREDVLAEGFALPCDHNYGDGVIRCSAYPCVFNETGCINKFVDYWNMLNAKRGYGWEKNDWVWVYAFERVTKEGGAYER